MPADRSRSPRWWPSGARPRRAPARMASSTRTAPSRAGSAAAAPSPSSFGRRSARSPTVSRGCSGCRASPGEGRRARRRHRARHDLPLGRARWRSTWNRICPQPHLWVVGTTPIAGALATLGSAAGWRVTLIDPIADADAFPAAARSTALPTSAASIPRSRPYVVVATQGQWDEEAVGRCAAARVRVRRPRGVADPGGRRPGVAARGGVVGEERVAALRAPGGMDIGAETPEEVAFSILAELVQVRRGRADSSPRLVRPPGRRRCPVDQRWSRRRRHRAARPGMRDDRRRPPMRGTSPSTRASSTRSARSGAGPDSSVSRRRTSMRANTPRCTTDRPLHGRIRCISRAPSRSPHPGTASGHSSWTRTRSASAVRGSRSIEVIDDTHFKATAKVGIGFISAALRGEHGVRRGDPARRARRSRLMVRRQAAPSTRRR